MAAATLMHRIEHVVGAIAHASFRRPVVALALAVVLAGAGSLAARKLRLDADLTALLPHSFESVKGIEELKRRFGGLGYVVVVADGADPDQLRRFADDMAPRLAGLPGVRFVDHRSSGQFFEDRALYYLSLEDLQEVERRVSAREKWERKQKNPFFLQLEKTEPPPLDFSDLEAKYAHLAGRRLASAGDGYYLDPAARMVAILVKPLGNSADLGYSKAILGEVRSFLDGQDLTAYGSPRIQLTGTFQKKIDQQEQIASDLASASLLAGVLLVLYLLFHFRSAVSVGLVLLPVSAGLLWTYGYVAVVYGSVNLLTGFAGAILGGLGFEHGIHLLGRYQALLGEGEEPGEAVRGAFAHTGTSALISSLVAALTFGSLAISEFRAFREFGVIAAVGMVVVLLAYYLMLPALLAIAHRLRWRPSATRAVTGERSELGRLIPRHPAPIAVAMGVVLLLLVSQTQRLRFNYDFASLEDSRLPSFVLDKKVNQLLGHSQTPVVILTDDTTTERSVVEEIKERRAARGKNTTIDFVGALEDLVPAEQERKRQVVERLARVVDRLDPEAASGSLAGDLPRLKRMVHAGPFTKDDLPEAVRRQFKGVTGEESGFVLVFPGISLADGKRVRQLAEEVRDLHTPSGGTISATGEPMVLADILDMVIREAPEVLLAALVTVLLAMWITLGSLPVALLCLTPTLLSILGLLGLMPLLDLPFNYLNIVVVPVLIGTTVDAGVHLVSRLREAGGDFTAVYGETGRAICGGLLTSAGGFGAMLLADHPGLNSIGQLANAGFALNLVVMLLGFPAGLLWLERFRARRQEQAAVKVAAAAPSGTRRS